MELPAVDLCYDALFERLRPDTIVMLFNVLICQRNVVVTAATIDGLTDVMEVALSLLWSAVAPGCCLCFRGAPSPKFQVSLGVHMRYFFPPPTGHCSGMVPTSP